MRSSITGDVSASWEMDIPHKRCRISCEQYEGISKFRSMSHDWLFIKEDLQDLSMLLDEGFYFRISLADMKMFEIYRNIWSYFDDITLYSCHAEQQCHMSLNLEMRRLLQEMWMWVRGMRISWRRFCVSRGRRGISYGRFACISKFRDMWHYSYISYSQMSVGYPTPLKDSSAESETDRKISAMKPGVPFSVEINIDTYTKT
jgi:hypothetical protein